jgi:hypothetical protein
MLLADLRYTIHGGSGPSLSGGIDSLPGTSTAGLAGGSDGRTVRGIARPYSAVLRLMERSR